MLRIWKALLRHTFTYVPSGGFKLYGGHRLKFMRWLGFTDMSYDHFIDTTCSGVWNVMELLYVMLVLVAIEAGLSDLAYGMHSNRHDVVRFNSDSNTYMKKLKITATLTQECCTIFCCCGTRSIFSFRENVAGCLWTFNLPICVNGFKRIDTGNSVVFLTSLIETDRHDGATFIGPRITALHTISIMLTNGDTSAYTLISAIYVNTLATHDIAPCIHPIFPALYRTCCMK